MRRVLAVLLLAATNAAVAGEEAKPVAAAVGVNAAKAAEKPRKKLTLKECLQKERDGGYDEPDRTVEEQFESIEVRFAIYLTLAKTEAEKDDVMDCMDAVGKRVVDRVKEKVRQDRFK